MFAKATKRPWRTKAHHKAKLQVATKPGQCVSVDQLESSVLGFIGHLKGILTRKRYKTATIFVDHFSQLSYVYLRTSTNGQKTVNAKLAFEAYANSLGVQVLALKAVHRNTD